MKAKIRKIVTIVEETRFEMGRAVEPPTRRAAAVAVIENPFAGRYVEDLAPLIEIGEELGELLAEPRGRGARNRGAARGKLRQGGGGRRERRTRACRGDPASEARRARPQGSGQRRGADSVIEEARRSRRRARRAARPQGRGLRAQPFRRHGSAHRRRAARQRNHGGGRRDQFRPPAAARRRVDEGRDQRASTGCGRCPFPPCGGRWPEGPDEGSRAERDGSECTDVALIACE